VTSLYISQSYLELVFLTKKLFTEFIDASNATDSTGISKHRRFNIFNTIVAHVIRNISFVNFYCFLYSVIQLWADKKRRTDRQTNRQTDREQRLMLRDVYWWLENMDIATYCNLGPPNVASVVLDFNYEAHNTPSWQVSAKSDNPPQRYHSQFNYFEYTTLPCAPGAADCATLLKFVAMVYCETGAITDACVGRLIMLMNTVRLVNDRANNYRRSFDRNRCSVARTAYNTCHIHATAVKLCMFFWANLYNSERFLNAVQTVEMSNFISSASYRKEKKLNNYTIQHNKTKSIDRLSYI